RGRRGPGAALGPGGGAETGPNGLEDGVQVADNVGFAADHEAEAAVQPEHPSARADVDIVDALSLQLGGPVDVVAIIRVAAVDDDVAGLHDGRQPLYGVPGVGRRHHHPGGARWVELGHELVDAERSVGPL